MKYKGIVFFDSDGTLTDPVAGIKTLTEKTVESLKKLEKNGYLAVLNTGRARSYASAAKFFDAGIFSIGAHGVVGDEELFSKYMDRELAVRIMDFIDEIGGMVVADNPVECYCNKIGSDIFMNWTKKFSIDSSVFNNDRAKIEDRIHKMGIIFNDKSQIDLFREKFGRDVTTDVQYGTLFADVSAGCSKGDAVSEFIDRLGVPFENTYAFGDSVNDLSMMRAVAHAIAMGDHDAALDSECEFITKSVKDEGITFGLEHYGLI
jgi:Cof subfamily protein (haloacid dehalogenase superfamily)